MADSVATQAKQIARTADQTSAAFARELRRIVRELERELSAVLSDITHSPTIAAMRAAALRAQLRNVLKDLGYDGLAATATADPFDAVATKVLAGRELQVVNRARLEAMRNIHYLDLLEEGDVVTQQVWRAVIRGTFGNAPVHDLVRDVAKVLDTSEARIQTLYDTSVSIYGRQVEGAAAGDEPETVFAYMGPVDAKTRDFCLERVGKVFTRAEIDEMDNEQIANVFLTGGGYNCRHVWQEVSRFSELHELKGTDQRAPEIQRDIDELQEAA